MTELKAHLLIFATMIAATVAVCLLLGPTRANGTLIALATILIGGAAAVGCSLVVMHYGSSQRRR